MEYKTIVWDRDKLYDQIWTRPISTVAKEYGLSDVGLAKICKKLEIPRPGLGYWRRKERGFQVVRVPLPKTNTKQSAVSHLPDSRQQKQKPIPEEHLSPVNVPPPSATLHPLVKQTERVYANGDLDSYGRISPSTGRLPHFDLRVTEKGLERAIRFLESFTRLLEANNMTAAVGTDPGETALGVQVDGEQMQISLTEDVQRYKRPPTPAEQRDRERWPSANKPDFAWEYASTNRLLFAINNYAYSKYKWADTKAKKIEECLEQIIHGLRAAAAAEKRARAEREVARRREAEYQMRRYEQLAKIEALKSDVARWEEAQRIRAYLAAVRKTAEERDGEVNAESPLGQFLAWAHGYADSLDPSAEQPGPKWKST